MLDAGRTACEDLISASQVQRYPERLSEPHERIVLAVNEHVSSALHVGFLWQTNEFAVKISVTRSAPSQPFNVSLRNGQSWQGAFMFGSDSMSVFRWFKDSDGWRG
jgi:hypothetical protein